MTEELKTPPYTMQVLLYNFTEESLAGEQGIQPGWYYTFPTLVEDKLPEDVVILAGPFDSKEEAIAKANDFIVDALTEHAEELKQDALSVE